MKTVSTPTRNNTEDSCNTGIAENLDVDDNLTTATAGVTETSMEETGAALDKPAPGETKQSSSIQETEPKDAMPCTNSSDNNKDVDDDDDDIPLAIIQRAIRRNQHTRTPTDSPLSSEHDDSGNDSDYVPSDVTDSSTEKVAPISFDRRKRKWVRRRNRPLKREQNRKDIMNKIYPESIGVMKHKVRKILTSTKTKINRGKQKKKTVSTLKQSRTSLKRQLANKTDDNLERAIKLSRLEHNVHVKVKGFHERRLSNLLISNGLDRISVNPDGNCFFNAIICQLDTTDSAADFRQKICEHLLQNEEHYKVYLSTLSTSDTNEEKISSTYKQKVDAINSDGSWNVEMSDILPLATANVYKRNITIYTSRLNNPVIHVLQDLETKQEIDQSEDLKLAYLALQGYEHYDACVPKALLPSRTNTSPSDNASEQSHITQPKTPSKQANEPQGSAITPRKDAAYISPKKVKRTRKRTANIQLWKKNVRKARKNTGKSYVSATTKRIIDAKCVQPHNCNKYKYKC
ncbi:MAG: OTU family ubiquitin thioesterase [Candidatus Thiodiazotropha endolucinida]|nr:hypothetical protein [Candidatus Thiodiazotropha taylori]MCW4346763.1 OTU family ubiquitin thioesterase [Candidatus Thiodiazotropha endolucinida]